ncbi:nucleotide exchange factor GrpE [Aeromicrobium sp. CTD01-1L150]|uniref:nucleotide exchange factor GrpE n=1 Tax=Aeromicrobium sp. CTD01-1L150 TaxID=3341830 RepID=UPI0035C249FD
MDPSQEATQGKPAAEADDSAEAAGPPADQPVSEPTVEGVDAGQDDGEPSLEHEPFGTPPGSGSVEEQLAATQDELAERTADLQRVHAEYQNYRKRVERDRAQARTQGASAVLRSLLTVLDDIGRAEQHGELEGGFKAVADQLRQVVAAQGLESFGVEGEEFDPRLHEALFQAGESAEVTSTTVATVVRTGYRVGEEILRDAQVGVLAPASTEPEQAEEASDEEE